MISQSILFSMNIHVLQPFDFFFFGTLIIDGHLSIILTLMTMTLINYPSHLINNQRQLQTHVLELNFSKT